ncbi:MAG: hypothetical protein JW959_02085 [Pirellulales bacterium]|nr:hypothetical protein [Pirellulales bacterium]
MILNKRFSGLPSVVAALAAVTLLAGCPVIEPPKTGATTEEPSKQETAEQPPAPEGMELKGQVEGVVHEQTPPPSENDSQKAPQPNEEADKATVEEAKQSEKPLVDHPDRLKQVNPEATVWVDPVEKRVVLQGQVCQRDALLEMFACLANTKEHESIVSIPCQAFAVHAALLAVGAKPGKTVQYDPEYVPASGAEIEIAVRWKDEKGEVRQARAQDWIRDIKTGKAMQHPWVFAGSGFWTDGETGKRYYEAESGDFICVSNFSSAMLDLPVKSSKENNELAFRAFTERIPPLGTPVTLVLTPKKNSTPGTPPSEIVDPKLRIQEEEEPKMPAEKTPEKTEKSPE